VGAGRVVAIHPTVEWKIVDDETRNLPYVGASGEMECECRSDGVTER